MVAGWESDRVRRIPIKAEVVFFFRTCRVPATGGKAEKVFDVTSTVESSPDGQWIYYSPGGASATPLLRIPASGGKALEVLPSIAPGQKFAVTDSGVWFIAPNTADSAEIRYHDFASKATRVVYRAGRPSYSGFALSPDQRRILFGQIERPPNHDLVLVDSFH